MTGKVTTAKPYLVVKVGSDPMYWVDFFRSEHHAKLFIEDQKNRFPDKYQYLITKIIGDWQ